ncbi:MAG: histidine kinase N-terminal 7TM domain-containing protein, partial [Halorientalis sp.]
MAVWLTGYRVAALVAALLSLFIVYESYQYREKRGVTPLVLIGIGAGVWIAVKLGVSAVRGTPTVFLVTRLNLVGHGLITTGFALFAIEYTGIERPVSTRTTALLLVEPALVNLLVWVDLGYLWRPVGQDPSTLSGYAWEWATIAVAHTAFAQL